MKYAELKKAEGEAKAELERVKRENNYSNIIGGRKKKSAVMRNVVKVSMVDKEELWPGITVATRAEHIKRLREFICVIGFDVATADAIRAVVADLELCLDVLKKLRPHYERSKNLPKSPALQSIDTALKGTS